MNRVLLLSLTALVATGCRTIATGAIADALSGGSGLGADEDPELVRDAAPFGLKTMESVLTEQPTHKGLLTSLVSGFTQYAYAFVQQDADVDEFEGRSSASKVKRDRARKLLLRAREYGLRGLEVDAPGIGQKLKTMQGVAEALATLKKEHVPLLYWTAAAWALAISNGKEDMGLVAELPAPGALVQRALELDPSWGEGTLYEFNVSYLAAKAGGTEAQVKDALDKALALNGNTHLGVWVSWAEAVLVQGQRKDEFTAVLQRVVSADAAASKDNRLANTIAQRRAKLLLAHTDDLFN